MNAKDFIKDLLKLYDLAKGTEPKEMTIGQNNDSYCILSTKSVSYNNFNIDYSKVSLHRKSDNGIESANYRIIITKDKDVILDEVALKDPIGSVPRFTNFINDNLFKEPININTYNLIGTVTKTLNNVTKC